MKIYPQFMTTSLLVTTCCLFLGISIARADDDVQGGDIQGTENLDLGSQMKPTAAAPAGSSIELGLAAEDDDGATQAELSLDTQALPPGTYNVNGTLKSTGATVAFGSFTLVSGGDAEINFTTNPQGPDDRPYPVNVNPFDIATVSVSDSNGVVLFTADLTNVLKIDATLNASITGQPGSTDPGATGSALLSADASHSKPTGYLQMSGQGLPVNTPLIVLVNGLTSNAKKASTSSTGSVSITLFPTPKKRTIASGVNLLQVKSATLTDKNGNVLLNFSF